jgi:hypothetical protein
LLVNGANPVSNERFVGQITDLVLALSAPAGDGWVQFDFQPR